MVLRSGGVKKGCRDDVVSSEDTEDTVKIRGAGPIEGDEKVDRRGRVDRRGGPSGARTGKVSTLSSAHLREVARRPTACSLEHRARARFDEEHLLAVGELESATAADGHQTRHRLGESATRSRSGIAAWHWPRRSTTCQARRSSGGPGPAAPVADTAIWSTLSWPLANVVNARALIYE